MSVDSFIPYLIIFIDLLIACTTFPLQLRLPETLQAKYFLEADTRQQATATAQEMISARKSNEKQLYECNDLRKKGLCLVPLSMLIDYIG
jgi:hypothetical protein